MIRTLKKIDGKLVWDPPYTAAELKAKRELFGQMCRSRIAPGGTGTDRTFMNDRDVRHHGLNDRMPPWMAEIYVRQAKQAGINITGKVYKGSLADGRGPACPDAWVGGTDDVLAVARKRNLKVEGIVNYDSGYDPPPEPDCPMAEDLLMDKARQKIAADPKWKEKPFQELREAVIDEHGAPATRYHD